MQHKITLSAVEILKAERLICHDPTHLHQSPIQDMISLRIHGHYVEVTRDGSTFNARVDGEDETCNLTGQELQEYLEKRGIL